MGVRIDGQPFANGGQIFADRLQDQTVFFPVLWTFDQCTGQCAIFFRGSASGTRPCEGVRFYVSVSDPNQRFRGGADKMGAIYIAHGKTKRLRMLLMQTLNQESCTQTSVLMQRLKL